MLKLKSIVNRVAAPPRVKVHASGNFINTLQHVKETSVTIKEREAKRQELYRIHLDKALSLREQCIKQNDFSVKNLREVANNLLQSLEYNRKNPEAYLNLANIFYILGEETKAVAYLKTANDLNPHLEGIDTLRDALSSVQQDTQTVIETATDDLVGIVDLPEEITIKASDHFLKVLHQHDKPKSKEEELLEKAPLPESLKVKAADTFINALKKDEHPHQLELHQAQKDTLFKNKSLKPPHLVVKAAGNFLDALNRTGQTSVSERNSKRLASAEKYLQEAKLLLDNCISQNDFSVDNLRPVSENLLKSLEHNRRNPEAYLNLANVLYILGENSMSVRYLQAAISINPDLEGIDTLREVLGSEISKKGAGEVAESKVEIMPQKVALQSLRSPNKASKVRNMYSIAHKKF